MSPLPFKEALGCADLETGLDSGLCSWPLPSLTPSLAPLSFHSSWNWWPIWLPTLLPAYLMSVEYLHLLRKRYYKGKIWFWEIVFFLRSNSVGCMGILKSTCISLLNFFFFFENFRSVKRSNSIIKPCCTCLQLQQWSAQTWSCKHSPFRSSSLTPNYLEADTRHPIFKCKYFGVYLKRGIPYYCLIRN